MKMIIAGESTTGGRQEDLRSPYDHELIATVPVADAGDVDRAIAGAVRGAEHQRRLPAYEREAILRRAGDMADARADELARTISRETGKPISEARGEASRVGDLLRLSGFEGTQLYGDSLPLDAAPNGGTSRLGFTLRQPCGVVVAITPFNFPALLVVHKLGPALATGNAVVLKPARQTPLTALLLCEILLEAGLHPEAISCLTGPGEELGDALCADPRVRKISFTGSSQTGERITRVAGVKRLSLELGASCPVVVLPDADIELAASAIAIGGYTNAGQVCISVQRVVADERVVGDLLDALVPKVQAIKVGDPSQPDTVLGSLISEHDAVRVETALREGCGNGAQVVTGGERDGSVLTPAVVAGVDPGSPLSQDELFGPAVAVSTASDVDHAIELANVTRYGLGAGVFTRDMANAIRFAREVDAGNVHVNWTPLWRADLMPYGGLKGSGIGKEGPRYAVEEMTDANGPVDPLSGSALRRSPDQLRSHRWFGPDSLRAFGHRSRMKQMGYSRRGLPGAAGDRHPQHVERHRLLPQPLPGAGRAGPQRRVGGGRLPARDPRAVAGRAVPEALGDDVPKPPGDGDRGGAAQLPDRRRRC